MSTTEQTEDLKAMALEALGPLEHWAYKCHAASVEPVRSGVLGTCRVARGFCEGVGSQHSWVILGGDCYDKRATIVDPTLWSYDERVEGIWTGTMRDGRHQPHGSGNIFAWGRPDNCLASDAVTLTPREPFSRRAVDFLGMLGPLDRHGWAVLAHAPVEGWPAGEILGAMCDSGMEAVVPIDIIGMVTDRNPSGLYLA